MQEEILSLEQFKKKMKNHSKEQILEMLYNQCLKLIKIEDKLEEIIKTLDDNYKI